MKKCKWRKKKCKMYSLKRNRAVGNFTSESNLVLKIIEIKERPDPPWNKKKDALGEGPTPEFLRDEKGKVEDIFCS